MKYYHAINVVFTTTDVIFIEPQTGKIVKTLRERDFYSITSDPNNPNIEAQSTTFNLIFLVICAVLGGMFVVYYLYGNYYAKKNLNNK